ncbi:MAG: type II secretion system protein N [Thermodesulfobacteriota bacterium]
MNIYGDSIISGRKAKLLNIILILLGIALLGWNISIWTKPSVMHVTGQRHEKKAAEKTVKKGPLRRSAYNRIITEDLFRETRKPYTAKVQSAPVTAAVQKKAPIVAPNLTLLGTIILNNGNAAVISMKGQEDKTRSYRVGESIGGFKITEITEKEVFLSSGAVPLKVMMNDNVQARPGVRSRWPASTGPASLSWPNTQQR